MDVNERVSFKARNNVVATEIDGGEVLLDLDSGQYFSLNETASLVWRGIVERESSVAIVHRILAVYDVDEERCVDDVSKIIEAFCSAGLVEAADK